MTPKFNPVKKQKTRNKQKNWATYCPGFFSISMAEIEETEAETETCC